jgi:hypothetical protein
VWTLIAALSIAVAPPLAPPGAPMIATAPYVSCRDGYVAPTLADCPPDKSHRVPPPPSGVGHGGAGGLLGLGGLGGIL